MNVISKVTLNFKRNVSPIAVNAVAGDIDTRCIKAYPKDTGELDGATARVHIIKSDKKAIYADCTMKDGYIYIPLTSQAICVAGMAVYAVELSWEDGRVLTSFPGVINIEGVDKSGVESSDEFSALAALLKELNKALTRTDETVETIETKLGNGDFRGEDGKTAYEVAALNGFVGTESEWLASLVGAPGRDGVDGAPGKDGKDGRDGAQGEKGEPGKDGAQGIQGIQGVPGKDGQDGKDGVDGKDGKDFDPADLERIAALETEIATLKSTNATLQEDLAELSDIAIAENVKGTHIHLDDSSNARFRGVSVFGQTTQGSTQGINLLDVSKITDFSNTARTLVNENGIITMSNKAESGEVGVSYNFAVLGIDWEVGDVFSISFKSDGTYGSSSSGTVDNVEMFLLGSTNASLTGQHTGTKTTGSVGYATFEVPEGTLYMGLRFDVNGAGCTHKFWDIQIQKGSVSSFPVYEPYTGGKPSPNQDYPQKMTNKGDSGSLDLGVCGRNLLDLTMLGSGTGSGVGIPDSIAQNNITVTATNPIAWAHRGYYITHLLKNGCEYILSVNMTGTYAKFRMDIINRATGVRLTDIADATKFVADIATYDYRIKFYTNFTANALEGTYTCTYSNVMLRFASDTSEFAPFAGLQNVPIPLPKPLRGLKVSSGGNYTDASGQQWVADAIVERDGEIGVLRNVGSMTPLTGWWASTSTKKRYVCSVSGVVASSPVLCTHARGVAVTTYVLGTARIDPNKNFSIDTDFETLADFNNHLAGNPITFLYQLAEPVFEPLPAETQAQIHALRGYYPITHVYNDADAPMQITYLPDTKKYLDNQLTELRNAIIAGGAI